jgi:hypothetical protein
MNAYGAALLAVTALVLVGAHLSLTLTALAIVGTLALCLPVLAVLSWCGRL